MERAPFFASKANINAAFKLAEEQGHFIVDDVSPTLATARIQVPVFLIHGQADTETPPAHSQRVFEALHGEKRLLLVPGAGHNDTLQGKVWDEIDAWVEKALLKAERGGPTTEN